MDRPKPKLDDLRIERREEPVRGSRRWIALVVLPLVILAGVAVAWINRSKSIEVHTVVAREVSNSASDRTVLNASGYVSARREATVSSKVTGKVTEVMVEEGMKVQEGQVLARLDDTNVKAGLRLAEAQLESARRSLQETRVRIREAEQELQRVAGLITNQIAKQSDFDHAEASALSLKARLDQQEGQVASWQQQLDDTIIRAPFTGIVTSKNAQPGEMISPISAGGGFTRTGICTIVDMASLEIEIDVNESYINRVQPGQPVEATLDAYSDWKIPCKVIAIIPTADRQKSTVKVRVGFDKLDSKILPELSVKVAFHEGAGATETANRMVMLPKAAVQEHGGRDVVLVVQNGRAERRAVVVSSTRDEQVLVSTGVVSGEHVITDPPKEIVDGTPVKEKSTP
jgi:HlyD family secretion protein